MRLLVSQHVSARVTWAQYMDVVVEEWGEEAVKSYFLTILVCRGAHHGLSNPRAYNESEISGLHDEISTKFNSAPVSLLR